MNKSFIKVLVAGVLAINTALGASAQEAEKARLGFCVDEIGSGLIAQTDQPSEYHAAIRLPNSILKKYVGNKITTIDFAILQKPGDEMTLFISRELGGQALVTQTISDFTTGWNSIKLKRPYTIRENDDLYVGYVFYTGPSTINAQVITFDGVAGRTAGVNFFGDRGIWNEVSPQVNYDLAIRAFVEGDNLPRNDVQIRELATNDFIVQNYPTSAKVSMWNFGLDEVTSMDVEISANGKVFDTKNLRDISVPHNTEVTLDVNGVEFPEEGNNSLEVRVINVNGKEDSDLSDNYAKHNLFAAKEGAVPANRSILFEQFYSEKDKNGPDADVLYGDAIGEAEDVVWIKHHVDDKFALDAAKPYKFFFDKNLMFFPALLADRNVFDGMVEFGPAYFINYQSVAEDMINISREVPSYIAPTIALNYDEASRKLNITASGEAGVKEMPFQSSLRLTVYLVEDKVQSATQAGKNEYVHNGVVRSIVTESCWGDEIDVTSYAFEKNYEVTLDKSWNADNIRVVAVVSNYDAKNKRQLQVYNTACSAIKSVGIDEVENDGREPGVWVVDGYLQIEGGYTLLGVYDLSGSVMDNACLTPGIYIVRTTDGTDVYHQKVIVK